MSEPQRRRQMISTPSGRNRAMLGSFRPGLSVPVGGEKPRDFRGSLRKLMGYLRPHSGKLAFVGLLSILASSLSIAAPKLLGDAVDIVFDGAVAGTGIDMAGVTRLAAILVVLYLFSSTFTYSRTWVMARIAQEVIYDLRRTMSRKLARLPLSYFDRHTVGDTLSRVTNDVDLISSSLEETLTQSIQATTTLIGVMAMMLWISPVMALVVVVTVPLSAWLATGIGQRSRRFFQGQQDTLGKLNSHIEEAYSGHAVVRAFNGGERSKAAFTELNDRLWGNAWRAQFISGIVRPATSLVSNLRYVLVVLVGGILVVRGRLTVGGMQAFFKYNRQFGQPIAQMANIVSVVQATIAAGERVFEFLDEPEEEPSVATAPELCEGEACGRVEFDEVTFGYEADSPVVRGVSFDVRPGHVAAIVGPTGAGKTTLVNLLMRFYDVDSGAIRVDGTDIRDMPRETLRALTGMVLQDVWLFAGTIADNIRYGRPDATDEEVLTAARAAHVDHFVRTLPDGYDTVINEEGTNVSVGQKQLITIARAVLADPTILILDEATSSIDTRTEILVQSAMLRLMRDRTSIVIAHRLSTIQNADVIFVLEDGRVVEEGNHEQLLARDGLYRSIHDAQFREEGR